MKILKTTLAAAAASLALGGAAMAQELDLSFNAGVASDYIFRGVSQTQEGGQVFGGADLTYGIGYAGVWASNVDFGGSEPKSEIDLYAGIKPTIGDVNLDFGVVYYGYVEDKGAPGAFSFFEVKAAASKAVGPATIGAALYYSPEFATDGGTAIYYEANASAPIGEKLSLSGAIGHQEVDAPGYFAGLSTQYLTWNVGVTAAVTDNLSLDFRYSDTDKQEFGEIFDQHFTVALKAAF